MKQLNKRQEDILTLAEKEGYVSVDNLAQTFEVHPTNYPSRYGLFERS